MYGAVATTDSRAFTIGRSIDGPSSNTLQEGLASTNWFRSPRPTRNPTTESSTSDVVERAPQPDQPPSWVEASSNPIHDIFKREKRAVNRRILMFIRLMLRTAELKGEGAIEHLPWSKPSEVDFWAFLRAQPRVKEPVVFLLDSGNIRAVWKNALGEQAAIEFQGYGDVQFVFFAQRPEGPTMARSVGQDKIGRIAAKIVSDGLTEVFIG
jgi:hypothetical protein